jgi:multidrug efflux pump
VVLVMFLFLRNVAATSFPAWRCPLSLVGTLWGDVPAGLQLEQPHLDGLDHFHRLRGGRRHRDDREHHALHRRRRGSRCRAALKGSEQIGFTIISLTISLIAVLIPLLFMGDIVGRLFREFAVTLSVTILVSAVVSLTLTPMMCAKLLKHKPEAGQGPPVSRFRACLQLG